MSMRFSTRLKNILCCLGAWLFINTSLVAQTTITFDDQGYAHNGNLGRSITIGNFQFSVTAENLTTPASDYDIYYESASEANGFGGSGLIYVGDQFNYDDPYYFIVKTVDGTDRSFQSFYIYDYVTNPTGVGLTVEAYRDDTLLGSQDLTIPASSKATYTLNSIFGNVDEIRIRQKTPLAYPGYPGVVFAFDHFVIGSPTAGTNSPPTMANLPSEVTVSEDATTDSFDISSAIISDTDAGSGELTLTLDATGGIFDIATGTGITITGHLTSHLTLTGNLADLNNYIDVPTNIFFRPDHNLSGNHAASVAVSINDNGHTGTGGGTAIFIGTVYVNITPVNDAPEAVDDELTVTENTPATGNVLTNDHDVEGNALIASLVTAPVNGTVVLNADGSFTYTPNANYNGLDSLIYQTCDNGTPSLCDTALLRFTVEDADNGAQAPFITTWQTTSANERILIPINLDVSGYNYTVDWGDGNTSPGQTGDAIHSYATAGTYTVKITGDFPAIRFGNSNSSFDNAAKLRTIEQWGTQVWQTMYQAFQNCVNLTKESDTDAPIFVPSISLANMFFACRSFNSDLNDWDVSQVNNMGYMFSGAYVFNSPIGNWDVSHVTDMTQMFGQATAFNQAVGDWDVSNVKTMFSMFAGATSFNQAIGNWDVSSVTQMDNMFIGATVFNQSLEDWDVSNVSHMIQMFRDAKAFNQPIGHWNVSKVVDMSTMFNGATAFNQNLGSWDLSSITYTTRPPINLKEGGLINMLDNSGLSRENYDATLIGWATAGGFRSGMPLGAVGLTYCEGAEARRKLIDEYGWEITGDAAGCDGLLIYVETEEGKTIFLQAESSDAIQQLKQKIKDKTGISVELQQLFFENKELEDGRTLADYNIVNESTLQLKLATNSKPIALDDPITVTEDTPATGNVLTNDSDPEGNALTASLVTAPVHGTVVLNANGSFTYTSNTGYSGLDSLVYQVCDNGTPSLCDTATVRFTITAVTPVHCGWATSQMSGTTVGCVLCSVTNPGQAIDGDKATYSSLNIPVGLSGGEVFQILNFATASTTHDAFRVGISTDNPLSDASSLMGLTLTFYHNDTQVAQYNDVTALALDPAGDGNPAELHVAPGVVFNRVRIALVAANGNMHTVRIHHARIAPPIADVNEAQIDIYEGKTATFTIADPKPGMTYRWYSESGELLNTGLNFTTPALSVNTTYYVATINVAGCEVRIPVEVRVLPPAPPELTTSGGTTTFTESVDGEPVPVAIDHALTIVDPDNSTLVSATLAITDNFHSGQDALSFTNDGSTMGNILANYNNMTGILSLTSEPATATLAQWQAALRSVTYYNTSQNPNTVNRTISFVVNDGAHGSNSATKMIAVVAVNNAPIAVDDVVTVQEDIPATGNVLTNDSDPEGNALTASLVTAPVNGTVVLNADGSFTYTPNANYSGLDSLVYQVCDNGTPSRCDTATMRFTVNAVNDAPVNTIPNSQTIGQNETLVWSAGNGNLISIVDVDAGGENVRVILAATNGLLTLSGTAGLSFSVGSGMDDATMTFDGTIADINAALNGLSFVPTSGYIGSASLQITTNDLGHSGTGEEKTDDDTIGISVIDGTNPLVTTVDVPADGYYREGDVLSFTVNFSEQIHVNIQGGTPYLDVIVGSTTVHADYQSGSGTDALMFTYTVQAGDQDLDGIALGSSLVLNGGSLLDSADNEALLLLNGVEPTDQVFVYSVRPTVTLSTTAGSPVNTAFTVTATYSEAVTGFTLDDLSIVNATSSNLQTADNTTYTFLVTPTVGGVVQVAVPADVVVNIGDNGNLASNTLEVQYSSVITGITLEDSSFVYDGTVKSLAISGTLPAGTAVSYENNGRTEVGTQEVTATVSGANYEDLVLKATLQISPAERSIHFAALPEKTYGDSDFDVEATVSSKETISYTSNNTNVATISTEGRIHIVGAGEALITAAVPENANYSNSPVVSRKLVVKKALQEISFTDLGEVARDAGSIPLDVQASSSLPIRLEVNDPQVATVSGTTLNVLRLGTVIITAYQEGDTNYEAADPVSIRVHVVDKGAKLPIKVHKALSPNGDGINDFLMIEGVKDYPDNRLVIVDRNGMQIIEMKGYNNADVVFRGVGPGNNPIPPGTYYYLLEVKVNGSWQYEKGYFVVRY